MFDPFLAYPPVDFRPFSRRAANETDRARLRRLRGPQPPAPFAIRFFVIDGLMQKMHFWLNLVTVFDRTLIIRNIIDH